VKRKNDGMKRNHLKVTRILITKRNMKYKQLHRGLKHAYVKVGDEHLERWKALQKERALYTNPQKWDIE